jgi:hypothetical protein
MRIFAFFSILLFSALFASCFEDKGMVEMEPAFVTSQQHDPEMNYTFLNAHIDEDQEPLIIERIQDHGFVWSAEEGNSIERSNIVSLGKRKAHYAFSGLVQGLKGSTTYYARAYIQMNDQVYYANEISFRTKQGTWARMADFPGESKIDATGFSLNNKGYLVGGTEVWEYDQGANSWSRKNDFPIETSGATSFVIENTAYVYCGGLWKYEPAEDSWVSIESPQDEWRYLGCEGITSFTSGGKAYLGGGRGNLNKNLLIYDPSLNEWTYSQFQAPNVSFASGFSLDGVGYIVGGTEMGNILSSTVLRYDIPEGDWAWKEPFRNKNGFETERTGMVCFQIQNRTYLGMGYGTDPGMYGTDVESQSDLYVYDPFADQWKVRAIPVEVDEDINVNYLGRSGGVSFAIGDKGYMGLGVKKRYNWESEEMEEQLLNDFWEFSVK